MKVYVIMVTPEASFSRVSQEAYISLSEAQKFIMGQYGASEKLSEYKYRDADYTEYEIFGVTIWVNAELKATFSGAIPGRKTSIVYSTKATSDLIFILSQSGTTIQEVCDRITYDIEVHKILKTYVTKGYGNTIAWEFFK